MRKSLILLGLLTALANPALAADATQKQLDDLGARIKALEANAQQLRDQAAAALAAAQAAKDELDKMKATQANAAVAAVSAPEQSAAPAGANGNAFNPAIAVIMNGLYAYHSKDPGTFVRAGFPGGTEPIPRGISVGESEVSLAANIDDKFYGQLTLSYADQGDSAHTNIEEAFIDTTTLPAGLTLRAGRFFSDIGYLNSHHAHTDNFVDRPLVYQSLLADQYGDDGVQVHWLAPTDFYLSLGGELFRGQNYPSAGAGHQGVGAKTAFAHLGGDFGDENSWLGGVSVLKFATRNGQDGFSGDETLYVADGTWKWAPQGNTKDGGVTVRSEFMVDRRDGVVDTLSSAAAPPVDPFSLAAPELAEPWAGTRRGMYIEGIYRINRTWDTGYRFDRLWAAGSGPYASTFDPLRHSVMLTWRNSEFSLLRLQYSHDELNPNQTDNALYLQYQVSLGAHGAHKF
ncbi:MAG: hypothetical protein ABI846_02585 [Rudaea sp.]